MKDNENTQDMAEVDSNALLSKENLLPCPFCGVLPVVTINESYGYYNDLLIECVHAACSVRPSGQKYSRTEWRQKKGNYSVAKKAESDAVTAWNKRI